MPADAVEGWDDELNAELYAQFTRDYPFYTDTSRDLIDRTDLDSAHRVVDLCGGTGATASLLLETMPPQGRVISVDSAAAMQTVGQRRLNDPRITWITAAAEDVAEHITEPVDAVVCNSAIWKTDTHVVFAAVKQILKPGGQFVFNLGGGFAGLHNHDAHTTPSLGDLITAYAVIDHGYVPHKGSKSGHVLDRDTLVEQLTTGGFTVRSIDTVTHSSTVAEKRAWLSIPVFARPPGLFTHQQRMDILQKAFSRVDKTRSSTTRWLVITAQR